MCAPPHQVPLCRATPQNLRTDMCMHLPARSTTPWTSLTSSPPPMRTCWTCCGTSTGWPRCPPRPSSPTESLRPGRCGGVGWGCRVGWGEVGWGWVPCGCEDIFLCCAVRRARFLPSRQRCRCRVVGRVWCGPCCASVQPQQCASVAHVPARKRRAPKKVRSVWTCCGGRACVCGSWSMGWGEHAHVQTRPLSPLNPCKRSLNADQRCG